jgi:hypothetical protein
MKSPTTLERCRNFPGLLGGKSAALTLNKSNKINRRSPGLTKEAAIRVQFVKAAAAQTALMRTIVQDQIFSSKPGLPDQSTLDLYRRQGSTVPVQSLGSTRSAVP